MDFLLPKLSATMETATVGRWLKSVGDTVKTGETLVELETDKATMEVESPVDGTVTELMAEAGAELAVGAVLARFRTAGEPASAAPAKPAPVPARAAPASQKPAAAPAATRSARPTRLLASPMAKRLAGMHDVDLGTLTGSGPHGRIRMRDVLAAVDAGAQAPASTAPSAAAPRPLPANAEPLSPMRSRIATAVSLSRQTIPSFVLDRWIDTSAVARARAMLGPDLEQSGGVKLTFTDFLLQALADCLAQSPRMLVRYADEGAQPALIRSQSVDIGLVVAVEDGVMIPVLRDLAGKSLASIAAARQAAVQRARAGRLSQADAEPASMSLSNVGRAGADRFEAIIQPRESSIIAIGREHETVVPRAGGIAVSSGINATLSVDHRLIDGVTGAGFLGSLADRIEIGPWSAH
ncbi:dihydrolipoamide acetyltransferase family protein [Bauldia litoralis]|uniref:Dihydrolipoamide acetyltransferase component of pyruvate dehydrogenase complex n=1 Tax=Bauldia litoralis TaxID=665467 RepID=A0A1G6BMN7_9HYPH|nr:dihydrolipoamide acetyltransferase family protein [Bauldia litoralis]SDB21882.1 pyruvate dehydrogenase E2 component (dihydrolipoamide acetyltransferase) [Bauldia litoralis]